MRPSLDDCPSISVSRLRAQGAVTADAKSTRITIAGVEREVRLWHMHFPNGGSWTFWICPACGRRARILRLQGERFACRGCAGLPYRCQQRDKAPRIERLIELLYGGQPARLRPRPGRTLDRRAKLERSLRRALIRRREERLKGWERFST